MPRHPSHLFRAGLRDEDPWLGTWLSLPNVWTPRLAAQAGFDFVTIDCEHASISDGVRDEMVNAAAMSRISPIVRVRRQDDFAGMKGALDGGAHGILVPYVETAEEVHDIVEACRFPPVGKRGVGSFFCGHSTGQTPASYYKSANLEIAVIIMIESVQGVRNVRELVATSGIDAIMIGEGDLAVSAGVNKPSSELAELVHRVTVAAKDAGIPIGTFAHDVSSARRLAETYNFVGISGDVPGLQKYWADLVLDYKRG